MSTALDPRISEFETQEQADSYDRWFRDRVQRSLDDSRSSIPHDDVIAEMRALLESKKRRHAAG
ncbi:stability determinant [Salinicola salarius]|uniref:type II toxin-antitoxin system RelB family antitoxin n=1 Tax=Salinicola salarius TaxID=430457 RepID=UPI0023E35788|nr:stability determinant [Salinicola salarius]MDF3917843.1 stability determinant [Salinicola salarius]